MKTAQAGDRVIRRQSGEHGQITAVREATDDPPRPPLGRFLGDDNGDQGDVHLGEFDPERAVAKPAPKPEPVTPEPPVEQPEPAKVRHTYSHKGGGYYDIRVDRRIVDTVKGKEAAEAWEPTG